MAVVIKNKFAKTCCECKTRVATGAGFAVKTPAGWRTYCTSSACLGGYAKDVPKPVPSTLRAVGDSLRVTMAYDREALPLLRSMPGARWDRDARAWKVSAAIEDRSRVLEISDKLGLNVPDDLRDIETPAACAAVVADTERRGGYPYQIEGVAWLSGRKRALLADEMGLGKTMQLLLAAPRDAGILVVCPASIQGNWAKKAPMWRPDLTPTVLKGRKALTRWPTSGEIFILNPEILPATIGEGQIKELRAETRAKVERAESQGDYVLVNQIREEADRRTIGIKASAAMRTVELGGNPSAVVLIADEAHMYKAGASKAIRARRIQALARVAARAWPATGTPVMNEPKELWGILSVFGLEKAVFGGWGGFIRCFGGYRAPVARGRSIWKYNGATPEASVRLRGHMLRRKKSEVLKALPPKTRTFLEVPMSKRTLGALKKIDAAGWSDLLAEYEPGDELPAIDEIAALRAKIAAERIPAVEEFAQLHEDAQEPLVVFSAHRAPIEALAKRDGWAAILGGTSPEERTRIVERFQAGELKGVALTIRAGGVGITLTRASHMLIVDPDWVPALNAQAEDRIHRVGQSASACMYTYMHGDHALERRLAHLLASKEALARDVLDTQIEYAPKAPEEQPTVRQETKAEQQARMPPASKNARVQIYLTARAETAKYIGEDLTPEIAVSVAKAFDFMCAQCDGAKDRDFQGWNSPDAARAQWIAGYDLTKDETAAKVAWNMCLGYKKQLGVSFPELWEGARKCR